MLLTFSLSRFTLFLIHISLAFYQITALLKCSKTVYRHKISHRLFSLSASPLGGKDLLLYNTLSRKKEKFEAISPPKVSFYSCGPTVYDFAHIGNFRAFLTYDLLKRWLNYCGYEVEHVCNLTDIDDKIITKMKKEEKSLIEITEKYSNAFFKDLKLLNIIPASQYPKATEHIHDIQSMISSLVSNGFAYEESGSVYFRVSAFENYGRLTQIDFNEIQEGAGGSGPNEQRGGGDKESSRDFALWKAKNEADSQEVVWKSEFGEGRPGWHIECSAMCNKLLGPSIDIHAGGVDLVFPHHENEIAQSEAYSGKQFANFWIHNGFVVIDKIKMSKSLQNFKTLRDIVKTPFDAQAFRYMVISSQYRAPLNFTPQTLESAAKSLKRIDNVVKTLKKIANGSISSNDKVTESNNENKDSEIVEASKVALTAFEDAMCDDMATPRATAALFSLINSIEKLLKASNLATAKNNENKAMAAVQTISPAEASTILKCITKMDSVFGVLYEMTPAEFNDLTGIAINNNNIENNDTTTDPNGSSGRAVLIIPEEIKLLAKKRSELKSQKLYAEADKVRAEIVALGYEVVDISKNEFDIKCCTSSHS